MLFVHAAWWGALDSAEVKLLTSEQGFLWLLSFAIQAIPGDKRWAKLEHAATQLQALRTDSLCSVAFSNTQAALRGSRVRRKLRWAKEVSLPRWLDLVVGQRWMQRGLEETLKIVQRAARGRRSKMVSDDLEEDLHGSVSCRIQHARSTTCAHTTSRIM